MVRFRQVSVVGNSSIKEPEVKLKCHELGRLLAEGGYSVVCGGRGGVMEAVCEGFKEVESATGRTIGILPGYQSDLANPFVDVVIPSGLDVARNCLVVSSGFVIVVVGGGAGTLSELSIASQLNKPIIFLKGTGGWADRITGDFLDERENARLYHCRSVTEVVSKIKMLESDYVDRTKGITHLMYPHES